MVESAYIHIPFCKRKCNYCSFVSYCGIADEEKNVYVNNLLKEIEYFYQKEKLQTLYFGGGTPSLLSIEQLSLLLNCFVIDENTEITIEINPESVDKEYLSELKKIGFNRLSIGVQTFDDKILQEIGRLHNSQKAKEVVKQARDVGFSNISVDFIYGLPNQSLAMFTNDLETAIELNVNHISLYGLKIEQGCNFYKNYPLNLPDDDMQADMYLAAIKLLDKNGFEHYEISNFSKKDKHSRHNLNYWKSQEYYGFGVAAHGYVNGIRYSNYTNLNDYFDGFMSKEFQTKLSDKEKLEEAIFLGFRCLDGINVKEIEKKYLLDFEKVYGKILQKYLNSGHIERTDIGYKFTIDGVLLSNIILSEFL